MTSFITSFTCQIFFRQSY